jgi:DNA-binding NarL/FixJ family response regulator
MTPEVVLMDIDMPGTNGIEATAIVKEVSPSSQVVMLTVSEEEDRIFQALRNGATGYLLKKSGPDELVDSVRLVHKGGSPMSPAIARKVLQFFHLNNISAPSHAAASVANVTMEEDDNSLSTGLTPREQEILEALVDGLSYKMIAARYFISTDTVKNHIQGIYRKLHVNSKGEAISYALKRGIAGNRS